MDSKKNAIRIFEEKKSTHYMGRTSRKMVVFDNECYRDFDRTVRPYQS